MRLFVGLVVGLVVASGLLAGSTPSAHAKSRHVPRHRKPLKPQTSKTRAARISVGREHDHIATREFARGQSVGAPWAGRLSHATQLPPGDGYYIRRPARSFGTAATVGFVERAIDDMLEAFPDAHVLA